MTLCPAPVAPPTDDHSLVGNLTDCKYFALFDTDDTSLANLVDGGDAVTQIGTLTFGADFMSTQSNAASTLKTIQLAASAIPQKSDDLWIVAVATRDTSEDYVTATGTNEDGLVVDECGLFSGSSGSRFKNSQASDLGAAEAVWPSNTANMYFMSGYGQARGHAFMQIGFAGAIGPLLAGADLDDRPERALTAPFILNADGEGNGEIKFSAVLVFHRLPALGEVQEIYTAMRDYFNGRGDVTVE